MLDKLDYIIEITILILKLSFMVLSGFILVRSMINKKIRKFLYEVHLDNDGNISWLRWVCSATICSALVLSFVQHYSDKEINETLIIGMIGAGLTGKVGQKFAENKNKNNAKNI